MNKLAAEHLLGVVECFLEAVSGDGVKRLAIYNRLRVAMAKAFLAQGAAFLKRFATLEKQFPIQEAAPAYNWEPFFEQASAQTLKMFLAALQREIGASLLLGMIKTKTQFNSDIAFDLANPRAVAYLRAHGAELVKGINETTRERLRTLIADGEAGGWSYGKMATAIKNEFAGFAGKMPQAHILDRATLVATTETGNAESEGNLIVSQGLHDAGIEQEHSWLVTGGNICDNCAGNAAQGWIPIDQPFQSGDMRPLQHPACRCAALYRSKPQGS